MKKEELYLKSNMDGLDLFVTVYIPEGKPKGIVQFAHGMLERQIYYYDFMEYLTNNGYITIINDHRGHGKSVKDKEDLGYFYDMSGQYVAEDLHQVTVYAKKRFPHIPVYLFGHSMGSLVSFEYMRKYDKEIDKLIICGLPSKKWNYRIGVIATDLYLLLKGQRYRSKFLNNVILPEAKETWLTNNKDYLKEFENDELAGDLFTINGIINLIKMMGKTYSKKGWKMYNKDIDILFLAGSEDTVIVNEQRWQKSIHFFKKLGYKNISYKFYVGCKHVVFKDKPDEVYYDVLNFIEK